jgi:hypothetical protein
MSRKYLNTSTFYNLSMPRRYVFDEIPPKDLVGDFDSEENVNPKGDISYLRRIPHHYPGGDVTPMTAIGIVGAIIVAIGVYAYMKGNPPQPPVG